LTEHARRPTLGQREVRQLLAHAVRAEHLADDLARLLEVVRRAGGDLAEDYLLRRAATEQGADAAEQLALRHQITVLERRLQRVAEGAAAARNDRHFLHRVGDWRGLA